MSASSAQADLGPGLPPRTELYRLAREVQQRAALAAECCLPGRSEDVGRAVRRLDEIRALLGEGR